MPSWHDYCEDDFDQFDQYIDHDYPELINCPVPECPGHIITQTDNHYGADADGRRGITVHWRECSECGEDSDMWEGEGE